jgi:CheY-like chemotaxis protein
MDMGLPDMDGIDVTRHMRTWEKVVLGQHSSLRLPIVALTAHRLDFAEERCICGHSYSSLHSFVSLLYRCLEAGMDAYMSKPVMIPTLKQNFKRWIRLKD